MFEEYITKIYKEDDIEVEIKVDINNKVWMSINNICLLLSKARSTIKEHIENFIYEEKADSVCRHFRHTGSDGKTYKVKHYSLEIVLK